MYARELHTQACDLFRRGCCSRAPQALRLLVANRWAIKAKSAGLSARRYSLSREYMLQHSLGHKHIRDKSTSRYETAVSRPDASCDFVGAMNELGTDATAFVRSSLTHLPAAFDPADVVMLLDACVRVQHFAHVHLSDRASRNRDHRHVNASSSSREEDGDESSLASADGRQSYRSRGSARSKIAQHVLSHAHADAARTVHMQVSSFFITNGVGNPLGGMYTARCAAQVAHVNVNVSGPQAQARCAVPCWNMQGVSLDTATGWQDLHAKIPGHAHCHVRPQRAA